MARETCHLCGKPAFAFLLKEDRSKIFLCFDHFPDGEAMPPQGEPPKNKTKDTPRP